jgi:hypothetical protein
MGTVYRVETRLCTRNINTLYTVFPESPDNLLDRRQQGMNPLPPRRFVLLRLPVLAPRLDSVLRHEFMLESPEHLTGGRQDHRIDRPFQL